MAGQILSKAESRDFRTASGSRRRGIPSDDLENFMRYSFGTGLDLRRHSQNGRPKNRKSQNVGASRRRSSRS